MNYLESMRRIILPQAVKRMIPAFLERVIELMKTTTLVATVSYADLLYQANNIAQSTYRPLEVFTVHGLYFVVLFPTSLLVKNIERQLGKTGKGTALLSRLGFSDCLASWPLLSQGLLNTLKLGLLTLITGLFFVLFVGLGRYSRNRWVNFPASVFVEVFRNTPALVQIMWFYFAFPIISPFDIDAFSAAALGLGLNTTAFCAEIFRRGIQSIHRGQWGSW